MNLNSVQNGQYHKTGETNKSNKANDKFFIKAE